MRAINRLSYSADYLHSGNHNKFHTEQYDCARGTIPVGHIFMVGAMSWHRHLNEIPYIQWKEGILRVSKSCRVSLHTVPWLIQIPNLRLEFSMGSTVWVTRPASRTQDFLGRYRG